MADSPIEATRRRILVVTNETAEGEVLHEAVRERVRGSVGEVLVVAPALNSRLRHWTSDEDAARLEAEARLRRCLTLLGAAGVDANGAVGDADPVQAVADALHVFAADEVVIATHPEERSHWLSRGVVERVRSRFGIPVLHVVVDRANGAEYVPDPEPPANGQAGTRRLRRIATMLTLGLLGIAMGVTAGFG